MKPSSRLLLRIFALAGAWGLLGGIEAGRLLDRYQHPSGSAPVELTAAERKEAVLIQQTVPMEIRLRVLSAADWERLGTGMKYPLLGYSDIDRHPCEIYIPAGWEFAFVPAAGVAIWADPHNSDVLAHEILHCIRGKWHPDWETIVGRKTPVLPKPAPLRGTK